MKDIPIIFSAPMVRALLDGRKTMTRRLAWGKPFGAMLDDRCGLQAGGCKVSGPDDTDSVISWPPSPWQRVKPGDRLWVRETWRRFEGATIYRADADYGDKWRSPIHMSRRFSRLTLTVTATKIERLQDISEAEAKSEGVNVAALSPNAQERFAHMKPWPELYRPMFSLLWRDLHGHDSWGANPEVVALTFTVERRNIDKVQP